MEHTQDPYVMEAYMLEVQIFSRLSCQERDGGFRHIGYMNKVFRSQEDACRYHDLHRPNCRGINAHGNYVSDWDPQTNLRYVVRRYHYEVLTIPPFTE